MSHKAPPHQPTMSYFGQPGGYKGLYSLTRCFRTADSLAKKKTKESQILAIPRANFFQYLNDDSNKNSISGLAGEHGRLDLSFFYKYSEINNDDIYGQLFIDQY